VISLELPRDVYVLQAGIVLNAFGNGAANPFVVLYLHDVRGIPLPIAGLVSATSAGCALIGSLAAGAIADRLGGRRTLLVGLATSTLGFLLLTLVRAGWHGILVGILLGSGIGIWLTGQSSLLAVITPPEVRPAAFAQQRVAANVGLGLGGFAGGALVTVADPSSFTRLFGLNACTFVAYACVIALIRYDAPGHVARRERGSYRVVVRDRVFVRFLAVNLVFVGGAIALLNGLMPVYARNEAGVSERTIGLLFLVNSLLIVVLQLRATRWLGGRSRMRSFAAMGVLFALGWLLVLTAGLSSGGRAVAIYLFGAVAVISVAECVYDTVQGPLTADLARQDLTGRYMALNGFSWQLGFIAGPAIGALVLAAEPTAVWVGAACLCVVGAGLALRLESHLPTAARMTQRPAAQST
jgi:MFS family permease